MGALASLVAAGRAGCCLLRAEVFLSFGPSGRTGRVSRWESLKTDWYVESNAFADTNGEQQTSQDDWIEESGAAGGGTLLRIGILGDVMVRRNESFSLILTENRRRMGATQSMYVCGNERNVVIFGLLRGDAERYWPFMLM